MRTFPLIALAFICASFEHALAANWSGVLLDIWNSEQCPLLATESANSEKVCKEKCLEQPGCTAIVFDFDERSLNARGNCWLRGCPLPVPRPKYYTNGNVGYYLITGCEDQEQCQDIDENLCKEIEGLNLDCPTKCGGPPCKDLPRCNNFNLTAAMCDLKSIKESCPLQCAKYCVAYSEAACRNAAVREGSSLGGNGYDFKGDYGTKGCYASKSGTYAGIVFYGDGGTDEEMKKPLVPPQYRPNGYDCSEED